MNKRCISILIFLIIKFLCSSIHAQHNFSSLGESSISFNHSLSKTYSINFLVRSRYVLYNDDTLQYQQQQVDIFHFSTLKLNNCHSLSFGLYYRNRGWFDTGSDETRIIEQYDYDKKIRSTNYGHRFRLEQRILDSKTIYRQRYRFGVNFPINSQSLDTAKTYLVSNLEGLVSFSKYDKPETDIRISSQIGWQISEKLKLQTGLEHRLEAFNLSAKNYLFILTSAIVKI